MTNEKWKIFSYVLCGVTPPRWLVPYSYGRDILVAHELIERGTSVFMICQLCNWRNLDTSSS